MSKKMYVIKKDANSRCFFVFKDESNNVELVSKTYGDMDSLKVGIETFKEILKENCESSYDIKIYSNRYVIEFYEENQSIICTSKNYKSLESCYIVMEKLLFSGLSDLIQEDV